MATSQSSPLFNHLSSPPSSSFPSGPPASASQSDPPGDGDLAFPPELPPVSAVWEWQGEGGWHCFNRGHCELLEAGWEAGQPAVYIRARSWSYRIDLNNMVQQNLLTRRLRHIRRSLDSAALWFCEGADGDASRYDPQIEAALEVMHRARTEQAGDGAGGDASSSVTYWACSDGRDYVADVEAMTETCTTTGEVRRICRCVLKTKHGLDQPLTRTRGTDILHLPSLRVGTVERGECWCAGNLQVVDSVDLDSVLLPVEVQESVDDVCAMCLEALEVAPSPPPARRPSAVAQAEKSGDVGEGERGASQAADDVVKLKFCQHMYHRECILLYVSQAARGGFVCPTCSAVQCTGNGPSPAGIMKWHIDRTPTLDGHSDSGTISVEYELPAGIQSARHQRPGSPFAGTRRVAYLPDTPRGREVLILLIHAFVKGHTFTVGTSVTTGRSDVVVWNGIHHKTNRSGGPTVYGYPDDSYFDRVLSELEAKGVTRDLLASSPDGPAPSTAPVVSASPADASKEAGRSAPRTLMHAPQSAARTRADQETLAEGQESSSSVPSPSPPLSSDGCRRSSRLRNSRTGRKDAAAGAVEATSPASSPSADSMSPVKTSARLCKKPSLGASCCGSSAARSARTPRTRQTLETVSCSSSASASETAGAAREAPPRPLIRGGGSSRREHGDPRGGETEGIDATRAVGQFSSLLKEKKDRVAGGNGAFSLPHDSKRGDTAQEDDEQGKSDRTGPAELANAEADTAVKRYRSNDGVSTRGGNARAHKGTAEPAQKA
ncbi:WWE domain-containing protein [Besnoitia besnoiti]|uniref:RING-type E3 ubiquitin transferase n=1 Tax=Besnoitia besnoiti TaxID=94643 RepID=A0A2A9MLR5_BESBE|nr:WWE domain-containing protein [Besnoitia besnoiti]PFH36996.1 WWE domain-containing protein [Besnoitia besnoiti]